jgi:hypothetical protein
MIDSEMNGNAKKILKNLLLSPIERDCYEFRRVLKSINIDENILIEIFLSRSNKQIQAVINNYFKCKFKRFVSVFFLFFKYFKYSKLLSNKISSILKIHLQNEYFLLYFQLIDRKIKILIMRKY